MPFIRLQCNDKWHLLYLNLMSNKIYFYVIIFVHKKNRINFVLIIILNHITIMAKEIIGLASDHAAFQLKQFVKSYLDEKGLSYKDYGTYNEKSCNYADYGHALANGIERGEVEKGIAMCGSGEGISMTLNKHQNIRAGLCWIPEIAHLIRQHNDANVLVMPGRFIDNKMASLIMDEFLNTEFEGGRHLDRINSIPVNK